MEAQTKAAEAALTRAYQEDIERHIAAAFYTDALEALLDMTRDMRPELKRDALSLYARYNRWRKATRDNLAVDDNIDRITAAILEFTDQVAAKAAIPRTYALESEPAPETAPAPAEQGADRGLAELEAAMLKTPMPRRDAEIVELPVQAAKPAAAPLEVAETAPVDEMPRDSSSHRGLNLLRTRYWETWRRQQKSVKDTVVISAESLRKSFAGNRFTLQNISLELKKGEITGVVGINASGKTTLLRLLLGEIRPDQGQIRYPAITDKPRDWRDVKAKLGYVPQLPPKWHGRLRESLSLTAAACGLRGHENRERVDYLLQRYGLHHFEDYEWNEISGGFKIRFEIVRAMLVNPMVLLLDEPLAYLDIITQQILLHDLKTIASSFENPIPIIVTSQHLFEIESIADKLVIIDDGICLFSGHLLNMPHVEDKFVFELGIRTHLKDLVRELREVGLVDVERTMTGYIATFERKHGKQEILARIVASFWEDILQIRDITQSTRSLFRNRRDNY